MKERELPEGWEWKKLEEIAQINPKFIRDSIKGNPDVSFIPMACVEEISGNVDLSNNRPLNEVIKGYTPLKNNDLIIAKITPCMENGKIAVANKLTNGLGFASTEFHVIRFQEDVDPNFYRFFFLQAKIRKQAELNMTGSAGQKRVPANFLKKIVVPLPPLETQKKIVAILEKAERIQRLREEADALTENLLQSVFLEMFGDPVTNPMGWETKKLGNVAKIIMGQSPSGDTYNNNKIGTPLLNGPSEFGLYYPTPIKWTTEPTKTCQVNDILFCVRGATAGRMNWADQKYCLGRGLAAIRPINDEIISPYLYRVLFLNYKLFQGRGRGSTFINISHSDLNDLEIPIPPQKIQKNYSKYLSIQKQSLKKQTCSSKDIGILKELSLSKAFTGELVS